MMNTIDSLKSLIAANPDIMTGAAGSGDIKEASTALAAATRAHGISLDAQKIEQAFQAREAAQRGLAGALMGRPDDDGGQVVR